MNGQWLNGGDGIRAKNLTVSGAELKAEGGDSNVTGTSDVMSGGGTGIRVDKGTAKLLDDAHITAKGGDGYTDNNKEASGGAGNFDRCKCRNRGSFDFRYRWKCRVKEICRRR